MMSLEPRMVLNGTDEHASRQKRKDELAARVEELGLFSKIKNLVTGKGFHDDEHPRGSDGRFAKKGSLGKGFDKLKPGIDSVKARDFYKKQLAALNADQKQWLDEATNQWNKDVASAKTAVDVAQANFDKAVKTPIPGGLNATAAATAANFKAKDDAKQAAFDAKQRYDDLRGSKPSLADYPKEREDKFPLTK